MALFSRSPKAEGENGLPTMPGGEAAESSARNTIGDLLRQTRQSYGGEIDRIATTLRIRAAYLTAIEASQYDQLPGLVYAQGFVRAYAVHLGLDGGEAIRRFKQEVAGFEVSRDLSFPMPLGERSVPGGTMVLTALILAICGYGLWYYVSTGDRTHPERVSAVPPDLIAASQPPSPPPASSSAPLNVDGSVARAPAADTGAVSTPPIMSPASPAVSATPAPTQSSPPLTASAPPPPAATPAPSPAPPTASAPSAQPATSAATAAATPPADGANPTGAVKVYGAPADVPVRIIVHAVKDSWIQVSHGDEILTQRILHPGDTVRVPDQSGLSLRTGNGAGIALEIDGKLGKPLSGTVRTLALNPEQINNGTAIQANGSQAGGLPTKQPSTKPPPQAGGSQASGPQAKGSQADAPQTKQPQAN